MSVQIVKVGFNLIGLGGANTDELIRDCRFDDVAGAIPTEVADDRDRAEANGQQHRHQFCFDAEFAEIKHR